MRSGHGARNHHPGVTRPTWARLSFVLALAAGLRITLVTGTNVINSDGAVYATLAENLVRGAGYTNAWGRPETIMPPGYPLATAAMLALGFPNGEAAGLATSFIAGMVVVGLLYAVGKCLYGDREGLWAAFAAALFPPFLRISAEVLSEAVYLVAWLASVWSLLAALRTRRLWMFALCGLAGGIATITRPEALALAATAMIAVAGQGITRRWSLRTLVAGLLALGLGFGTAAAPYAIYLQRATGRWTVSGKMAVTGAWGAYGSEGTEERERSLFSLRPDLSLVVEGIGPPKPSSTSWGAWLLRYTRNLYEEYWLFSKSLLSFGLIALMGIGVAAPPWDVSRLRREAFLAGLLAPLLVFPALLVADRFLIPSACVFLLWIGRGLVVIDRQIQASLPPGRFGGVRGMSRAALPIILLLTTGLPTVLRPILFDPAEATPLEWRAAGQWLRTHVPPTAILLTRRPEIAYYAGRRSVSIPYASLEDVRRYAQNRGAGYLVLDERFTAPLRPQMQSLTSGGVPAEFELQHVEGTVRGRRVFIYALRN